VARKRPEPRPTSQSEDRRALFAGVKDTPDDDAPRLVLADWLEEHGDDDDRAHAELIRVQCEALRRAASLIDPDRPEPIHALLRMVGYHNNTLPHDFTLLTGTDQRLVALKQREKELLDPWQAEHRIPVLPRNRLASWDRGFASLYLKDVPFRSRDMAALSAGPFGPRVDQMALRASPGNVAKVARSEMLAHLTGLDVNGQKFGAPELATLVASPHLARLRRLDLGLYAGWDMVKVAIRAPQCPRLTHLYLYSSRLDPAGFRDLAAADLRSLESLHLGGTSRMGAAGAKALASPPFLAHLRELILTNTGLGPQGVEALASSPHFHCPARLEVGMNGLGAAGLRALLAAPGLVGLVALELFDNAIDDAAVADLAGSARLSGLLSLDLRVNPGVGPAGAEALAGSPHLARLASLDLRGCGIGEVGVRALLRSPHLRRLQLALARDDKRDLCEKTLAALRERFLLVE
jgi:uncharacterized protein (TIGR02996 family)